MHRLETGCQCNHLTKPYRVVRTACQAIAIVLGAAGLAGCWGNVETDSQTRQAVTATAADVSTQAAIATDPHAIAIAKVEADGATRSQVLVNGTPVVSFAAGQGKRARVIAERLQSLAERQQLRAHLAQPDLVNGMAVAAIADDVIFTVDEETARWYDEPPAELTVKWVNNLRLALGGTPLSSQEIEQYRFTFPPQDIAVQGLASWYGPSMYGRSVAGGDNSASLAMSNATETSLPQGTYLHVSSPSVGRSVVMRVASRGPRTGARVLDVSKMTSPNLDVGVRATEAEPSGS